jgi:arylsulfatase A
MVSRATLAALLVALTYVTANARGTLPNIVLYVADDLGVGEVNQHAPEWVVTDTKLAIDPERAIWTPNLARLASEGMRLTRSYAASPLCGPSRFALMTGVPTGRSRVRGNVGGTERGRHHCRGCYCWLLGIYLG